MCCSILFLFVFSLLNFLSQNVYADLKFSNRNSTIAINSTNSLLKLGNVNKVFGWTEESIVKAFGDNSPSQWVEGYTSGVVIAQTGGTAVPYTNLIYSNSNAINSIKPLVLANSNSVIYLNNTERTNSNAFAYGIKNNSNAIIKLSSVAPSGLVVQNSNAIVSWVKQTSNSVVNLSVRESSLEVVVRTNSNAFAYGIKNNSNAIIKLTQVAPTSLLIQTSNAINALSPIVRTGSNAFAYGIKNNSNAIIKLGQAGPVALAVQNSNAIVSWIKGTSNTVSSMGSAVLPTNNSNAIVKLNASMQTIDHGPTNIQVNAPTYRMTYDIYLSANHTINFQSSCTLNGYGHTIQFAKNNPNILIVTSGRNVVLSNVVLQNFNDLSIQLGSGSSLSFGNNCTIDLADELTMSMPWVFSGNAVLNGCGNSLNIAGQRIQVLPGSNLTIDNTIIGGLANANISCLGNANIAFNNATLQMSSDYYFTSGSLEFQNDVIVTGTSVFNYQTNQVSIIDSASSLVLDSGVTFNYAPSIANRDLITMQDITSQFYLNGCTLISTTTGLRLTVGTLTLDGQNTVENPGAVSLSQGISFGDGIHDDNLNINFRPGGSINIMSGVLDYQNVN